MDGPKQVDHQNAHAHQPGKWIHPVRESLPTKLGNQECQWEDHPRSKEHRHRCLILREQVSRNSEIPITSQTNAPATGIERERLVSHSNADLKSCRVSLIRGILTPGNERHANRSCQSFSAGANSGPTRIGTSRCNPGCVGSVPYPSSASRSLAMTVKSSRVVVSPLISPWVASSLSRRRMILPERVLGRASVKRIPSGRAREPISFETHLRSSSLSASLGWYSLSSVTKAEMACPFNSSGRPTTAASATLGWATRADSTSMVPRRWPLTLITSSTRPMSQK